MDDQSDQVYDWPSLDHVKDMPTATAMSWFYTVVTHNWTIDERMTLRRV